MYQDQLIQYQEAIGSLWSHEISGIPVDSVNQSFSCSNGIDIGIIIWIELQNSKVIYVNL